MKLDLGPVRNTYVSPSFDGDDRAVSDPALVRRMRRPMITGALIILVMVIGLGTWAAMAPLASGITAPAQVRVEANRKTLRKREAGTVRQILVKEGQLVRAGQPVIMFNDTEPKAALDVLQNQYDSLLTQSARFTAEATNKSTITFPPEITSRMSDPRVAGMVRDQEFLFTTRLQLFQSQTAVLSQRLDQIQNQIAGDQAQVEAVDENRRLTIEELDGYRKLNAQGFAPKTLILRYERTLADLAGRKGSLMADIARLRQQMGETRMNMSSVRDQRTSQAAEGLRDSETRIADLGPRLTAARQTLDSTVVRSPVDGYVFNLTQFTVGGLVAGGELMMDIVPVNSPMVFEAMINPQDVDQVKVGMPAHVRLAGQGARWRDPLPGKVTVVSADSITNEKSGRSFYRVDIRVEPADLLKHAGGAHLTPGMPASAMIVTGKKTIMGFLISPITDTISHAFREP
jgi:HlyD family type I secretion membrane fusion protein